MDDVPIEEEDVEELEVVVVTEADDGVTSTTKPREVAIPTNHANIYSHIESGKHSSNLYYYSPITAPPAPVIKRGQTSMTTDLTAIISTRRKVSSESTKGGRTHRRRKMMAAGVTFDALLGTTVDEDEEVNSICSLTPPPPQPTSLQVSVDEAQVQLSPTPSPILAPPIIVSPTVTKETTTATVKETAKESAKESAKETITSTITSTIGSTTASTSKETPCMFCVGYSHDAVIMLVGLAVYICICIVVCLIIFL